MEDEAQIIEWIETYQFDTAREHLNTLREKEPTSNAISCWQSVLSSAEGENEAALEAADQVLKGEPDQEWALRCRIGALLNLGRHEEALKSAQQAMALNEDDSANRYYLAAAHFNLGNLDEAVRYANRVSPQDQENWLVQNLLMQIAAKQNDYAAAEKSALRSLASNPLQPDLHYLISWIRNREKQYPEAIQSGVIAAALAPDVKSYKQAIDAYVGSWLTPRLWCRIWIGIVTLLPLIILFQPAVAFPIEHNLVGRILLLGLGGIAAYTFGWVIVFLIGVGILPDHFPLQYRRKVESLPNWTQAYLWRNDGWNWDPTTAHWVLGSIGLVGLVAFLRISQLLPPITLPPSTLPPTSPLANILAIASAGTQLLFLGVFVSGLIRAHYADKFEKQRKAELETVDDYPEYIASALKIAEERWPISWLVLPSTSASATDTPNT